jgi:FKBP-type peptidyl-prolyl cis-trans isomerase FkpA
MFKKIFLPLLLMGSYIFLAQACGGCKNNKKQQVVDYKKIENDLLEQNKKNAHSESVAIDEYIKKNNWKDVIKTGTGLRYTIIQRGDGILAKTDNIAKVNYKVSLLDGTLCYSSERKGPHEFKIGQDDIESGLHEGITYMHVGDKAKFLLPSHLAHGFTGDQKKIPSNSPILYEIELLGLR